MSKHRVDLNLRGTSHYVDGKLVDATGFPLWENTLPSGLRLEKRAGRPAKRDRKFVRTPGFGVSVEWTSNRDASGAQRAQHRAAPPPGQRRRRHPGPQRGEQRGNDTDQDPGQEQRRDPGLFNVPGGDSDDDDDAHSRAPSRRDDDGILHSQTRLPRREHMHRQHGMVRDPEGDGEDDDDAHSRAPSRRDDEFINSQTRVPRRESMHQQDGRAHGPEDDGKNDRGVRFRAPSGSNNFGVVHDQNNKGNPRGSDPPDGARKTRGLAPIKPNREEPPPWLEYQELLQWERDHGVHKAPSRRDNSGVVNRQNSSGHPRGSDRPDRDRRARGMAPVGSKVKAAKA